MKTTVKRGNLQFSGEFPILPEVGEQVRVNIQGASSELWRVKERTWVYSPGNEVEVELDCR